jgi:hypothetical protein
MFVLSRFGFKTVEQNGGKDMRPKWQLPKRSKKSASMMTDKNMTSTTTTTMTIVTIVTAVTAAAATII